MMQVAVVLLYYFVCCQANYLYIDETPGQTGTIDCGGLEIYLQRAVYGANYGVTNQVEGLCQGKTQCQYLDATNSFANGDPCVNHVKGMWLSGWCDNFLQEFYYIPEGKSGTWTCPDTAFNINFAIYGTWTDVTDKVKSECAPQATPNSCVVSFPSNDWAGTDPCPGTFKALWISYDCV